MLTTIALILALQDAKGDAEKAIQAVRAKKSYRTKFTARIEAPGSDPLEIKGENVWVNPGVLYIQYTGSGGDNKRILRVGDKVWVYHEFLEDWVSSEEMGTPGAGRGVQNPDEILSVLSRHMEKATRSGDTLAMQFTGADIETIMKEQSSAGSFDWKKSNAVAKLSISGGLVSRFSSSAELVSTDPKLAGKTVKYSADVEVVSYEKETELRFWIPDEKTKKEREILVPEHLRKAVAGYLAKKP